jgi:hypothetical protein
MELNPSYFSLDHIPHCEHNKEKMIKVLGFLLQTFLKVQTGNTKAGSINVH